MVDTATKGTDRTGLTPAFDIGDLVTEGKTKKIVQTDDPACVEVVSKTDITAGDGAKHDVIPGKDCWANETACNVFRLLKLGGIDVAFLRQESPNSFIAPKCTMLPYEVVGRREAHGSFAKRNPHVEKGQLLPKLVVEFFLKTKNRRWKDHELICDDPLMGIVLQQEYVTIELFDPAKPRIGQKPFLKLVAEEVFDHAEERQLFHRMDQIARKAFLMLEKAWQIEEGRLVDFKCEFGLDPEGKLLLADVIDNDSWRVIENGTHIDKQVYRDGGALDDVAAKYRRVAMITSRFSIPHQRVILWRGSEKDDLEKFRQMLDEFKTWTGRTEVTCSVHKEPVRAAQTLGRLVQEVPDSVLIVVAGRSNGAGPILSAMSTVPVITVPANVKDFPEDVWSSLRSPSDVPVMTVMEPANAVLAALQILSARNPVVYAQLRSKIEERLVNVISI